MEDLVDLIATESSSSQISDKIKEILFAKASEKIDNARPMVAASMFDEQEVDTEE
jgi:hypothetical protein